MMLADLDMLLTTVFLFVAMTVVWLRGYALVAAKASGLLQRPSIARALDRLTGIVLIGLGVRLATEHR
jgi:threonine/homoserine/homoserine lactone efflux protein